MRSSLLAYLCSVSLCASFAVAGQEHGGHHDHGAPDLGNIGKAKFASSCNEAAQKEIDRGVALIHSFWYAESERAFRNAAAADPKCGVAWWGVAMSNYHPLWAPPTPEELKRGREAAARAVEVGGATDREKGFIDAINAFYTDSDETPHPVRAGAFQSAMKAVSQRDENDDEAAIFYALSLLGTASPNDKTYANQKKAAEILNRVLPRVPEHPGVAHYIIHSFDYPELASLALPAARAYSKLAPGSPHALHMPSHIFTRLGLWDESITSNLASADKARKYVEKLGKDVTAFEALHATDYLVYAYLQQRRLDDAKQLVDRVMSIKKVDQSSFAAAYAVAAVPARWTLERRAWNEAAALPALPSAIAWDKFEYAEANYHFAKALGAARSGKIAIAEQALGRLASLRQRLRDQKNDYWSDQVEIQRVAAAAWLARAKENHEDALKLAREAADLEARTEKHPVTPGAIIPARELLAEMLLESGKPREALTEIERTLEDSPNRFNALSIAKSAAKRSGEKKLAEEYERKLKTLAKG